MAKSSKTCMVTREEFNTNATNLDIEIAGQKITGNPKEFSTGSLGWYLNGKINVMINGKSIPVQIGCNITIVGSKELAK